MLPHLEWWETEVIAQNTEHTGAKNLMIYSAVPCRLDCVCSYTLMVKHQADSSLHPHGLIATSDKNINNQVGTCRKWRKISAVM